MGEVHRLVVGHVILGCPIRAQYTAELCEMAPKSFFYSQPKALFCTLIGQRDHVIDKMAAVESSAENISFLAFTVGIRGGMVY